jgi:hypothetical protein
MKSTGSGKGVENLIKIMRKEGARAAPEGLRIAKVGAGGKINLGDLTLDPDDYNRADGIEILSNGDNVVIGKFDDEQFVVICKVV